MERVTMERFIIEQNVTMLIDMLHTEIDLTKRATAKALLVEEENKFGEHADKLQKVEGRITICQGHIVAQHKLIDRLRSNGSDCLSAEQVLINLTDLLELFRYHRQTVLDGLNGARI